MQDLFFFFSKHVLLISIWFCCLIILIFFYIKNIFLKSNVITNVKAIQLINQENAIVIDTRIAQFFQKGHILNSINIPLENIFLGNIDVVQKYKKYPIILILKHTYEYNKCVERFLKYGFKNVYILKNGLYDWHLNHLPLFFKDIQDK